MLQILKEPSFGILLNGRYDTAKHLLYKFWERRIWPKMGKARLIVYSHS
jgi:hypothetical protein